MLEEILSFIGTVPGLILFTFVLFSAQLQMQHKNGLLLEKVGFKTETTGW